MESKKLNQDDDVAVWAANMIDQKTEGRKREELTRLLRGDFLEFQKCAHINVLGIIAQYAWEVDNNAIVSDIQALPRRIFEALKKRN